MASNQTTYYGLSQWQASDKVERLDFNADNQKIDAAMHGLEAGKATAAALTSLTNTVNTKASQTDLTALETTVTNLTSTVNTKASQASLTALQNTVNTKASQASLTALQNTVNTKAAQSALNTLTTTVNSNATKHTNDVAALRSENCWVKLGEITLSADAAQMNFSLPSGQAGLYRQFRMVGAFSGNSDGGLGLTVNGLNTAVYKNSTNTVNSFSLAASNTTQLGVTLYLTPFGASNCVLLRTEGVVEYKSFYTLDGWCYIPSLSIYSVASVQIFPRSSSGTIAAGSSLAVYGLKR